MITQNIDRLHRVAGTQRLIEVHGSIEWSVCLECGGKVPLERVIEQLRADDGAPECACCITPLKPDVVLFGELLPERALAEAQALALDADLMVCVGSSLEVYPVAGLPAITRGAGGRLALVTQGPTPYDDEAEVKLGGDVVEELRAVLARAVNRMTAGRDRRSGGGPGGDWAADRGRRRQPGRRRRARRAFDRRDRPARRARPASCGSSTCRACGA